jgi:tRNA (guanine37-N1)-methyltransferase
VKITVLTLFPEMFNALNHSILSRAQKNGLIEINVINIRDFTLDKNKRCDDYSYGGGAGMIMTPQPLFDAIQSVKTDKSHTIYMSPKGKVLSQEKVEELSKVDELVLICGHYEGIDQRIIDLCVDEEISIGDYVLTGGEIPAMVLVDCVARYVPKVLGNEETTSDESFSEGLLEYPQWTRPFQFEGLEVPQVLLDGNHKEVDRWRLEKSLEITKKNRPDLYRKYMRKQKKMQNGTKKN